MIELFLFINPIGPICYDIEKEILNKLKKISQKKKPGAAKKSICRSCLSLTCFP